MPDWSNDWAEVEPGFYVHCPVNGVWLAGGWTDDQGRRRPLIGWRRTAKRFHDRAAAERAADYLNRAPWATSWRGEWEVIEQQGE